MATQEQAIISGARAGFEAINALRAAYNEPNRGGWHDQSLRTQTEVVGAARHAIGGESARQLHVRWMRARIDAGWTYGDVFDEGNKFHPALVPYDDLHPEQRAKGQVFVAVTRVVSAACGYERATTPLLVAANVDREPPSGGGAE